MLPMTVKIRILHLVLLSAISIVLQGKPLQGDLFFTTCLSDSLQQETQTSSGIDVYPPVKPDPFQPIEPPIDIEGNSNSDYRNYPTPPDASSSSIYPTAFTPVGVDVSPLGASTFTIPIDVPVGIGGITPKLSISYNSMSGNSMIGLGCSLQGISVITRSVRDIYHNGNAGKLSYNEYDALCLDGVRMIPKTSNIMADGLVYVLENDPFTEITLHGTEASSWFEMKTKDGRTIYYGNTENSRQKITPSSEKSFVNSWYVSRIVDSNGNYMTYNYLHDNLTLYPLCISYGSNTSVSSGANNTINFIYRDRSDVCQYKIKNIAGNISKLLSSIESKTDDTVFRHINLSYSLDYGSTINRLQRVQVCRDKTNKQKSIEIAWTDSPGFTPTATKLGIDDMSIPLVKKKNQKFISGDINGDGVADILEFSSVDINRGVKTVEHSNYCIPYVSSVNTDGSVSYRKKAYLDIGPTFMMDKWKVSSGNPFLSDINGDGLSDLVVPFYNSMSEKRVELYIYWGNTDGLSKKTASSVVVELLNTKDIPLYASADFDNDGRNEFLFIEPYKGNIGMNVCQIIPYAKDGESVSPKYFNIVLNVVPQQLFTADFNGDGLTDFMIVHKDGCYTYLNRGDGYSYTGFMTPESDLNVKSSDIIDMGDFNGDGIPDMVMFSDSKLVIALGNGDGHFSLCPAQTISGIDKNGFNKKLSQTLVFDFDGDGKSDLVMVKAGKTKGHTFWLRSLGTSFALKKDVPSGRKSDSTMGYYALGDFNGDGYAEMMNYGYDAWGGMGSTDSPMLRIYPNNVTPSTKKVQSVTDGIGNRATFSYKSLTTGGLYKKKNDAEYPILDCLAPLSVVSSLKKTNGAAGENTTEYTYEGLKVHLQGKGLLGMTQITAVNRILETKQTTETSEWNIDYCVPQKTRTAVTTGGATETTETIAEIEDKGKKALFIYPKYTKVVDADGNMTEKTAIYNASNGTPTTVRTLFNDGSYLQTEFDDYVKTGGMWLAQSITERRKHVDDNAEYTDRTKYAYDSSGNVCEKTTHADTPKQTKTTIWRDYFGNVSSYIMEGDGISEIEYYSGYDATGRFVVKKDNDTGPTSMSYTYDIFGNLLTETDDTVEDNKLTTRYNYNTWGQKTKETTATGAEIKTWYGRGPNLGMCYYKLEYSLGQPWKKTWYDSCGRIVKTESVAGGGLLSTTETKYNSKGQETETVHKAGKLTVSTTKEYDSRGRTTKISSSTGKNVSYVYGNRSVSITESGRTTVKEFDAQDNVRKVTDPVATLEYKYYSNGNPSSVTCGENTVRMEYDEAGNRITLDDPDAGVTKTVYDAEGKIQEQTDGRGVKQLYRYDSLGHLICRTGALQDVSYSYDKRGNITREEHDNRRITNVYDRYNRLTAEQRDFNGEETQIHRYQYNKFGDIIQKTYANGPVVDYVYDAYGNNTAMIINNDTVWQEKSFDGLVTTENLFSGKYTYQNRLDKNNYLAELILKKTADESKLRHLKYKYDGTTGNMTSRSNEHSGVEEVFSYDNLDRLVSCHKNFFVATSDGTLRPYDKMSDDTNPVDVSVSPGFGEIENTDFYTDFHTDRYTYSADGNILTFPTSGTYLYSREHPHAVESINNPVRNFAPAPQDIYYNDIGKTYAISENKEDGEYYLDFYYGPDDERWTTSLEKDGKPVKTILFGNGYEKIKDGDTLREFTYIGNGLLHYRENGGESKLLYMFTDAQGSIREIYDRDGNVLFSADYDPWGNITIVKNDIGFIRGYTGHEMLLEFGLINMNGRMYDPQLGRFLSPDNYVQMPDNSQNFNRYSYCLNNPLKYTDPSGEFWNLIFGAAVGGLFNWASHGFKYNAKGLGYFLTGAIAGAVSTGVASGVNVAMAGGNFWKGAVGMLPDVLSTGFFSGAATFGSSAFVGSFITDAGNSWVEGQSFGDGLLTGLKSGYKSAIAAGIMGGIASGIDALGKNVDFWTGNVSANLDGAYSCKETDPNGLLDMLQDKNDRIMGKYVGDYQGQHVFESKVLGTYSRDGGYSAFTLPDHGIIAGKGVFTSNTMNGRAMIQHEFGHVLQYRIVGAAKYYTIIAKESFLNCAKIWPYNKISHDLFWTETWANYLSKQYFGGNWLGMDKNILGNGLRYYPAINISKSLMKDKFGL